MRNQKGFSAVIIIVMMVVILAAAGGAFWYINNTKNTVAPTPSEAKTTAKPQQTAELEKELNEISLTDVEEDFKDIDKDINSL